MPEYKGNDAKLIEVKFTNGGYLNSIEIVTPKLFDDSANGSVSGYYYEGDIGRGDKLGVIRFFQGFAGVAVKDYGFVFVGADGNTSTAKEEKISGGESAALQPADVTGFFGTLTDIAENHFGEAVYAKGYVTIGDVTIFSDALITNEKVDSNNYVTDPTE